MGSFTNGGSDTFRTRKNGANGNQVVTVNATGVFEDNTNTDSISATDKFCYQTVPSGSTNTFTYWVEAVTFDATTDTVSILNNWVQNTQTTASTTWYFPLASRSNSNVTTETFMKVRIRKTLSLKKLGVYVQTNRATNTTLKSRKNGADGSCVVTITGGGAAGWYEDTTNSDSLAAGDDSNTSLTTGTGSDTLQLRNVKCEIVSTSGDGLSVAGDTVGVATTDNNTSFFVIGGRAVQTATENATKVKVRSAFTFSNVGCMVEQNDVSSASTFKLRKNGGDVNNTVSVTGNGTGIFIDTTHTDTVAAGDDINTALVVPAVAGTHTVTVRYVEAHTNLTPLDRISLSRTYKYNVLQRVRNYSLLLDGTDDLVNCGNHSDLWSQGLTKFSWSIWIYGISGGGDRYIDHGWNVGNESHIFVAYGGNTITPSWLINNSAGVNKIASAATALTLNQWSHIVGVYDNSLGSANVKIYINKTVGATTANLTETINASKTMYLGHPISIPFHGNVKDFRFWKNKALTQTEIDNIYDNNSSAPAADYWLPLQEGTGNPTDNIAGKTTSLTGTTWENNNSPTSWVGKFSTLKYNLLGRISQSRIYKYHMQSRVSLSRIYKYHILSRVSLSRIYKYHLLGRISLSRVYKYNVIGRISLSRIYKYHVQARVSLSRIYKYHVANLVSLSRTYKYNIIGRVSLSRIYKYHLLGRISVSRSYLYNVVGRISLSRIYKYNIQARVSLSRIYKYNLQARVSLSRIYKYHVTNLVSLSRTYKYNILGRVSLARVYKYHLQARVSLSRIYLYNVIGRISLSRIYKYNIQERISQSSILKYNILQRINLSQTYKYHVQSRVSLARTYLYNVLGRISKPQIYKYNVLSRVSLARTYLWNVLSEEALERISKSQIYKYHIQARVSLSRVYKYNVLGRITKELIYKYHVFARISLSRIYKYNLIGRISKTSTLKYHILARISLSRIYLYHITNLVSKSQIYKYNVLGRVSLSRIYKYNLIGRISQARIYKWDIVNRISLQRIYKWNILQRVGITNILKWDILTRVSRALILVWDVGLRITTRAHSITGETESRTQGNLPFDKWRSYLHRPERPRGHRRSKYTRG